MIQLNLLSTRAQEKIIADRHKRAAKRICRLVVLGGAGLVIVFGGVLVGLCVFERSLSDQIDDKISTIDAGNENDGIDNLLTIQRQLSEIDKLHDRKPTFSRLLDLIYRLGAGVDLQSVKIKNSEENILTLVGSVKDFAALNSFKELMGNAVVSHDGNDTAQTYKVFESVDVNEASTAADNKVGFRIEAKYNSIIIEPGEVNLERSSSKGTE